MKWAQILTCCCTFEPAWHTSRTSGTNTTVSQPVIDWILRPKDLTTIGARRCIRRGQWAHEGTWCWGYRCLWGARCCRHLGWNYDMWWNHVLGFVNLRSHQAIDGKPTTKAWRQCRSLCCLTNISQDFGSYPSTLDPVHNGCHRSTTTSTLRGLGQVDQKGESLYWHSGTWKTRDPEQT